MNSSLHKIAAIAAALLLCGASTAATAPGHAASAAKPAASAKEAAQQRAAAIKPVDINIASKAELMKLPGIAEADAQRIIQARPYLSKAYLVTHNVIPMGSYQRIAHMIIAKQPGAVTSSASAGK